jgi:hypothetical protein
MTLRMLRRMAAAALATSLMAASAPAQDAVPEHSRGRIEQAPDAGRAVARFSAPAADSAAQAGQRAGVPGATGRGSAWTQSGWEKVTAGWRAQDGARLSACTKEAEDQRLEGNTARSHIASCMNRT